MLTIVIEIVVFFVLLGWFIWITNDSPKNGDDL